MWPRYKGFDGEDERVLGVWLHGQRQKRHRNLLSGEEIGLLDHGSGLDAAAPQTGGEALRRELGAFVTRRAARRRRPACAGQQGRTGSPRTAG